MAKSAAVSDISPHAFLERGSRKTLYVVSPSHEQRRLRPLFETLLHTVISYAYERASQDGPLSPPLLLVLDEAANIAPLRDLDALASTAAGHGIQLVSIFQDLAQITNRYRERAQTVINNHRAKILLSGISDTQTLEYASRLLGDEEILQSSITRGAQGSRSTTESTSLRSIAPANVLRGIRPGEGVLVYKQLVQLRRRSGKPLDVCVEEIVRLRPQIERRHVIIGAVTDPEVESALGSVLQTERDRYLLEVIRSVFGLRSGFACRLGVERFTVTADEITGDKILAHEEFEDEINSGLKEQIQSE